MVVAQICLLGKGDENTRKVYQQAESSRYLFEASKRFGINSEVLTSVVEVVHMDSLDHLDWGQLTVAAGPALERRDRSHRPRHARQPAISSRDHSRSTRKDARLKMELCLGRLCAAASPEMHVNSKRTLVTAGASISPLAPPRPVGSRRPIHRALRLALRLLEFSRPRAGLSNENPHGC